MGARRRDLGASNSRAKCDILGVFFLVSDRSTGVRSTFLDSFVTVRHDCGRIKWGCRAMSLLLLLRTARSGLAESYSVGGPPERPHHQRLRSINSVLGSKVRWWIDAMGAVLLSLLVSPPLRTAANILCSYETLPSHHSHRHSPRIHLWISSARWGRHRRGSHAHYH